MSGEPVAAVSWTPIGTPSLDDPVVQTYVPEWTKSTGGPPVLGNGSLVGIYYISGKRLSGQIVLILGSTSSTLGATNWRFSFPVPLSTLYLPGLLGIAEMYQISTLTTTIGSVKYDSWSGKMVVSVNGSTVTVGGLNPFTWGQDDRLSINFDCLLV